MFHNHRVNKNASNTRGELLPSKGIDDVTGSSAILDPREDKRPLTGEWESTSLEAYGVKRANSNWPG
jgi:hypothetical protein